MTDLSPYVRVIAVVNQGPNHRGPLAVVDTITSDQDHATRCATKIGEHARRNGHPLPNLAATQTVWIVPVPADILRLLDDLTDADDCCFDHHGGCRAHGYLSLEPGQTCPHAAAKALLDTARKEGLLPDAQAGS